MDERLVKVETDVAYIQVGMGELKSEIKGRKKRPQGPENGAQGRYQGSFEAI